MAEAIGLASGLLTLASFASKASLGLYQTIQSFRTHPKRVRDLAEELEALVAVLQSLTDTAGSNTNVGLSALDLPLLRCGKACEEFEQELVKCSSRSGGDRTSFRDWAKLKYLGDNIDEFKHSIAGYKATITIALNDATLRTTTVTADRLEEYRDLIETATDDLEARLEVIDEKLATIFARTATGLETTEIQRINEERLSTQKCLLICAQLSEHIEQIQPVLTQRGEDSAIDSGTLPENITSDGMKDCKVSLHQTTTKLENHMQDLLDCLIAKSSASMTQEEAANLSRLREEWTTARQCRDICSRADKHLNENISIIDNHATGDEAVQFLVSTGGKTIHGKNRGHGFRIRQVGGHLSDESVQQLSRDISRISFWNTGSEKSASQGDTVSKSDDAVENKTSWQGYGNGRKLESQTPLKEPELNSSQERSGTGL